MSKGQHKDIVIVGGGIIGSTLANLLLQINHRQRHTLRIALIDTGNLLPSVDLNRVDPRVIALSTRSANLYRQLDLWQQVARLRSCAYQKMYVWDAEGTGNIHFDCADIGAEQLGHIVENRVLLHVLQQQVHTATNLDYYPDNRVTRCRLTDGGAELELEGGEHLSSALVVAADGAHSAIREMAAIDTRQWDYGQDAIVSTVRTEKPHQFTAWQRFSIDGPLAFLPLNTEGGQQCSIVWSLTRALANTILTLDEQAFCAQLSREFEYTLGKVTDSDSRHRIALYQRHATRYWSPGVVLVGDAAHSIHPLAGQGANLGIYDIEVLAEEVERAVSRSVPLHHVSILQRYERRRQGHNLAAMAAMEGFKRLFGSPSLPLRWLRNTGLRRTGESPWLKQQLCRLASGR